MPGKVVLQLDADAARTLLAMQKIVDQQVQMARAGESVSRVTQEGERHGQSFTNTYVSGLRNMVMGLIGVGGVVSAIKGAIDAQLEWRKAAADTNATLDESRRKFFAQALTTDPAAARAIEQQAIGRRVPLAATYDIATEMVSRGFTREQVTGGGLDAMLKLYQATGMRGEPAAPVTAYMRSQGMPLGAEGIRDVGSRAWGLFRSTSFQLEDLQELAGVGATLRQRGISVEDQLSAMTILKESGIGPAEGTTALRALTTRLATARTDKGRAGALRRLGIAPERVDLIGEDLPAVLDLLGQAVERLPETQRAGVLKELAGERQIAQVEALLAGRGRFGEMRGYQRDVAGYERAAGIMAEGPAALRRGFAAELEALEAGNVAASEAELRNQFREVMYARRGLGGGRRWAARQLGRFIYGVTGEWAESADQFTADMPAPTAAERDELKALIGEMRRNTVATDANTRQTQSSPVRGSH